MTGAGAGAAAERQTCYEVYLKQGGRWLVQEVFTARDEALAFGASLVTRKGVEGVRVVREIVDAATGDGQDLVIFDSELRLEAPEPVRAEPPSKRRHRQPEPEIGRERPAPVATPGFPWLSVVSGVLGLALAAAGLWFISAMA